MTPLISGCATKHHEFFAYCEVDEWFFGGYQFREDLECYSLDAMYHMDYISPMDDLLYKDAEPINPASPYLFKPYGVLPVPTLPDQSPEAP